MKGATTKSRNESMTMRSLPTDSAEEESSALFAEYPVCPHSPVSVGRLQMASDFLHQPVLLSETVSLFSEVPPGVVVDATVGGGGHSQAILDSRADLVLLGIDRDPLARDAALSRLASHATRSHIVAGEFGDVASIVSANATFIADRPIVGILMDLGVSSPQLDDPTRGFSYRADAPLDMRMDPTGGATAAQIVASIPEAELSRLLHHHGETRFARSIARSIKSRSPRTTGELVEAVEAAVPAAARRRGHVASRVFQALRVEVNDEEGELDRGLNGALSVLGLGGVLVVISYHSGEDRVVKSFLRNAETGGCTCPPNLPCVCGAVSKMRLLKASAVMAREDEIARNARSRSARLRAGWRIAP